MSLSSICSRYFRVTQAAKPGTNSLFGEKTRDLSKNAYTQNATKSKNQFDNLRKNLGSLVLDMSINSSKHELYSSISKNVKTKCKEVCLTDSQNSAKSVIQVTPALL